MIDSKHMPLSLIHQLKPFSIAFSNSYEKFSKLFAIFTEYSPDLNLIHSYSFNFKRFSATAIQTAFESRNRLKSYVKSCRQEQSDAELSLSSISLSVSLSLSLYPTLGFNLSASSSLPAHLVNFGVDWATKLSPWGKWHQGSALL